ncbi:MAG: response regulator [Anaerolineales bacterium]|nr:response regulator [Anaerolineales bacterium]
MGIDRKTILIVEDEPNVAEMFVEMFRVSDYEVYKCLTSSDALELARQYQPDLIVMDVMMPEISGLTVLQQIRAVAGLETLPVIVVSSNALPKDIQAGLDAGAMAYLAKPISYPELIYIVNEVIDRESIEI